MKTRMHLFITLWLLVQSPTLFAQSLSHLEAPIPKGYGAMAFLRAYGVYTRCNLEYFYQLNRLSEKTPLVAERLYKLPVLLYNYNGKSIRSTIGNDDRPMAEAILAYNDDMHRAKLKAGDFRQDRELWVPYHMLNCPEEVAETYVTPVNMFSENPRTGNLRGVYDIFGKEHAEVPLISNTLRGCVYYIVSGHGGPDPGAVGRYYTKTLCEDEYAYDIALRLARNLLSYGATVYIITRDPDDGIRSGEILNEDMDEICWGDQPIPVGQSERLTQRSDAINELFEKNQEQGVMYQRCVVMHIDSRSKRKSMDMYFYHQADNVASYLLASTMQRTLGQKYDQYRKGRGYNGSVSERDLHMLREVLPVSVFIELGNIKNPNDQARFVIEGNRQLIANWLAEGLVKDRIRKN